MTEVEEIILGSARHGDLTMVKELIAAYEQGKISNINLSCKGMMCILMYDTIQ